jgi:hypothetical protein
MMHLMFAATAARKPTMLSSMTTHLSEAIPSLSLAVLYMSGSGFNAGTSSPKMHTSSIDTRSGPSVVYSVFTAASLVAALQTPTAIVGSAKASSISRSIPGQGSASSSTRRLNSFVLVCFESD